MATGAIWLKVPETIRVVLTGTPKRWVLGKDLMLHLIGLLGVDGALYRALEFAGDGAAKLSLDSRLSMANMAIECGAKNGIFEPDAAAIDYVQARTAAPFAPAYPDPDAAYARTVEIDAATVGLQVALPHLPSNAVDVSAVREAIDQVVIGSCTNGRIEDLRVAAEILRGREVAPKVRLIVIPGSRAVLQQALAEGLVATFVAAGAAVSPPTCGPCLGGHMGVLAKGEKALATTNRNFVGRMGDPGSEVYLCGPAVAAASAVVGRIASPEEL
jgi:3-isopropylmalate/(R)-2-methylmalate dehydratase large subunit